MKRTTLLLWLGMVGCAFAFTEFPNPRREWRMCGRPRASFVCDPEFILDLAEAEKLDQIAREFQKSTSCICPRCPDNVGVSVGVFIRHNISRESTSMYPDGKKVAEMLRRRWNLSTCQSDVVIVLLTQQNISEFSMGPAVQRIFPGQTAEQIMRDCGVHFESGFYYQGLESTLNSFNDVLIRLQRQYDHTATYKNLIVGVGLGFAVLFILAVTAVIILHRQGRTKKRNCSEIYEGAEGNPNQRKKSFDQEDHLERLRKLNSSEEEDDEDDSAEGTLFGRHAWKRSEALPSVHFTRLKRQLSDVTEESSEDCETKRNSERASFGSSYHSPTAANHNIPVTEL